MKAKKKDLIPTHAVARCEVCSACGVMYGGMCAACCKEKQRAEDQPFDRYWRVRRTLPDRYGQRCRITARGTMNSCRVEFEDGFWAIVSRWSVRKITLSSPAARRGETEER
jgi:hypothetical protein